MHFKRRLLGQHFLQDSEIIDQMIQKIWIEHSAHSCASMMEIGPGRGALTRPLLEKLPSSLTLKSFLVVEKDFDLAAFWETELKQIHSENLSLKVEKQDFLNLPVISWVSSENLVVISNLPYSASTAILIHLTKNSSTIPIMLLMFQAEVAQRLYATPKSSVRGSLSVWIQNLWEVELFLSVPPSAFRPRPQVNSEVLLFRKRAQPQVIGTAELSNRWENLLKIAFSQKRRMLRSLFRGRYDAKIHWEKVLENSEVDSSKRAEALDWDEWNRLFLELRKESNHA